MIKKAIIKTVVILLVFVSSFLLFSGMMNSENIDRTMALSECTLPVVSALCGEREINYLYGYVEEMDGRFMRDVITPLDEENKLTICIKPFGREVRTVGYEVRSLDTQRLIEKSQVANFAPTSEDVTVRLDVQDLLESSCEYLLKITLSTADHEMVHYYTRIVRREGNQPDEKLDFVLDFHRKTLEKSQDVVRNLESNSTGSNGSFAYADIHSSFSHVTFGNLEVRERGSMQVQLQEINNQTAVVVLRYQLESTNDAQELECFNVREFYRVRYTKDRMYLLEFERTMDEVFLETNNVYYSKAISLGVADEDVEYVSNTDGNVVSFVQQGNLYSYNRATNVISKIYGYSGGDDVRYDNQDHEIKIVSVDESGSTNFIVIGYVARGENEGRTGIGVFRYDSLINGVEEKLFIRSKQSAQVLRSEVDDLTYMSTKGTLYVGFADDVYEIRLETGSASVLVDGENNGAFVVSKNNVYMAWQQEASDYAARTIHLMNLNEGSRKTIHVDESERIKPIGFMGDDLVYGIARVSDLEAGGWSCFPMYKLIVMDEKGNVVKEYQPSGSFVVGGTVTDNMLKLERVAYSGGSYAATTGDQIVHSSKEEERSVLLASITTDRKKREQQLQFRGNLKEKAPTCLYPKLVIYEEKDDLELDLKSESLKYYVYAKGVLDSTYDNAVAAMLRASDVAGVVVTENQTCIYERTKKRDKAQWNVPFTPVSESGDSLAACVIAVCNYYGLSVDVNAELAAGKAPLDILSDALGRGNMVSLAGQSLDNVLYGVSAGYPVIVRIGENDYGVIVGYDAYNTILMNPRDKTGYVGMEDGRKLYESYGNIFIQCIKN